MISAELLAILRCPDTMQRVAIAPVELVQSLNEKIGAGSLKNRGGQPVAEPLEAALIREDKQVAYPVRHDIPVMLIEESIALD